ncbi:hypothetical protein LguiA_006914 [Lonicera macranthoides]
MNGTKSSCLRSGDDATSALHSSVQAITKALRPQPLRLRGHFGELAVHPSLTELSKSSVQ